MTRRQRIHWTWSQVAEWIVRDARRWMLVLCLARPPSSVVCRPKVQGRRGRHTRYPSGLTSGVRGGDKRATTVKDGKMYGVAIDLTTVPIAGQPSTVASDGRSARCDLLLLSPRRVALVMGRPCPPLCRSLPEWQKLPSPERHQQAICRPPTLTIL